MSSVHLSSRFTSRNSVRQGIGSWTRAARWRLMLRLGLVACPRRDRLAARRVGAEAGAEEAGRDEVAVARGRELFARQWVHVRSAEPGWRRAEAGLQRSLVP